MYLFSNSQGECGNMITLVAAMDKNRIIGANGLIPFALQADVNHFQETTTGHIVVMGRKTFESIGKPLPGRTNVVLTNNRLFKATGVVVVHSFQACLQALMELQEQESMIIGGEQIYKLFLPHATKMILTHVNAEVKGDTFFPEFNPDEWDSETVMAHGQDQNNQYAFVVNEYVIK